MHTELSLYANMHIALHFYNAKCITCFKVVRRHSDIKIFHKFIPFGCTKLNCYKTCNLFKLITILPLLQGKELLKKIQEYLNHM